METTLITKITTKWAKISLVQFLSTRFKYHTEDEWKELIFRGKVLVNNSLAHPDYVLSVGDLVLYQVLLREPPVNKNIRIVYRDEYFLVASKPPNLPSHADGNFITHTFIYLLNEMLKTNKQPYKLVNRLDRETSGIIVASNNMKAHKEIARQFEKGEVYKEYIAIVRGEINEDEFAIEGDIVPDINSKISIRRTVAPHNAEKPTKVVTMVQLIERLQGYTVVRCIPKGGKTAQIRVHLAHAGYPLAGDKLYGRSDEEFLEYVSMVRNGVYKYLSWMDAYRHMLHAQKLSFVHPHTHRAVEFIDPLPDDMLKFVQKHKK